MKVISFKVEDDIYIALKKKKVSFRVLFEQYAIQQASCNRVGMVYSPYTIAIGSSLYIDLVSIQKTIEKILKNEKKETK